jgi:uncharacterized membrane protein YoaK (UPF0700 family)
MLQASALAIIAGYADTVGYLHFGAFAGLMTGNTILLGIEIATGQFALAAFHILIIAAFLMGVMLSRAAMGLGWRPWLSLSFAGVLLAVSSFIEKDLGAILLALAMGTQNSAANRFGGVALNTVFITGNLQKLGEELVALVTRSREERKAGSGAGIYALVWISYAAGATLGALANAWIALPLLIPALALPFVMHLPAPKVRPTQGA